VFGEVGAGHFFVDLEGVADDAADGHPRIERAEGVLENQTDAAADVSKLGAGGGENVGIVEGDFAGGGGDKAEYASCDGGLAAAAFTDETKGRSVSDGEGDAVDGLYVANGAAQQPLFDGEVGPEVFDPEQETIRINVGIHMVRLRSPQVFVSSGLS